MDVEPINGYEAHMRSTCGVYIEDPIHEYWRLQFEALKKYYEDEEKRFAALSPREQYRENLMDARYGRPRITF